MLILLFLCSLNVYTSLFPLSLLQAQHLARPLRSPTLDCQHLATGVVRKQSGANRSRVESRNKSFPHSALASFKWRGKVLQYQLKHQTMSSSFAPTYSVRPSSTTPGDEVLKQDAQVLNLQLSHLFDTANFTSLSVVTPSGGCFTSRPRPIVHSLIQTIWCLVDLSGRG